MWISEKNLIAVQTDKPVPLGILNALSFYVATLHRGLLIKRRVCCEPGKVRAMLHYTQRGDTGAYCTIGCLEPEQ